MVRHLVSPGGVLVAVLVLFGCTSQQLKSYGILKLIIRVNGVLSLSRDLLSARKGHQVTSAAPGCDVALR